MKITPKKDVQHMSLRCPYVIGLLESSHYRNIDVTFKKCHWVYDTFDTHIKYCHIVMNGVK